MSRIANALLSGLFLGAGIGSAMQESWIVSAGCFVVSAAGLFVFVRACLRRIF
jgi:hypothetical protein